MPWQGTRCPLATGWQERLTTKVLLAAGLGSATGAVLAILERKPLRPYMLGTGASAAICLGLFGVLQEGMRVVRCHDSSINSTLAAGAASYILVSFQSGRQKAVPAALYCSLGAGSLHWLSHRYDWGGSTRRMLVRLDLLDDEEVQKELERPKLPYSAVKKEDLGWRRHLPIRKLTEEEWEQYQTVRKQRFKDRGFHSRCTDLYPNAIGTIGAMVGDTATEAGECWWRRVRAAQSGGIAGILEEQQQAQSMEDRAARQQ